VSESCEIARLMMDGTVRIAYCIAYFDDQPKPKLISGLETKLKHHINEYRSSTIALASWHLTGLYCTIIYLY
jgi:hypothetical protein